MGEFELLLRDIESNVDDCSEFDLELFISSSNNIVNSLLSEITEVEQLVHENSCPRFGQAVFNYKMFLDGQIKEIQSVLRRVSTQVELLMINTL